MKIISLRGVVLIGLLIFNDAHDHTDGRTVCLEL